MGYHEPYIVGGLVLVASGYKKSKLAFVVNVEFWLNSMQKKRPFFSYHKIRPNMDEAFGYLCCLGVTVLSLIEFENFYGHEYIRAWNRLCHVQSGMDTGKLKRNGQKLKSITAKPNTYFAAMLRARFVSGHSSLTKKMKTEVDKDANMWVSCVFPIVPIVLFSGAVALPQFFNARVSAIIGAFTVASIRRAAFWKAENDAALHQLEHLTNTTCELCLHTRLGFELEFKED